MANPFPFSVGAVLTADQMNGIGESMTAYTPTWTGTGGTPTLGNGTLTGLFTQVNKLVFFRFRLTWGSTTSATGVTEWRFTLPVAASGYLNNGPVGFATVLDSGTALYRGIAFISTSTRIAIQPTDGVSTIGSVVPFTWTTNDAVQVAGFYEVA
jgi:uncharacterized protein (DUF697 family)